MSKFKRSKWPLSWNRSRIYWKQAICLGRTSLSSSNRSTSSRLIWLIVSRRGIRLTLSQMTTSAFISSPKKRNFQKKLKSFNKRLRKSKLISRNSTLNPHKPNTFSMVARTPKTLKLKPKFIYSRRPTTNSRTPERVMVVASSLSTGRWETRRTRLWLSARRLMNCIRSPSPSKPKSTPSPATARTLMQISRTNFCKTHFQSPKSGLKSPKKTKNWKPSPGKTSIASSITKSTQKSTRSIRASSSSTEKPKAWSVSFSKSINLRKISYLKRTSLFSGTIS